MSSATELPLAQVKPTPPEPQHPEFRRQRSLRKSRDTACAETVCVKEKVSSPPDIPDRSTISQSLQSKIENEKAALTEKWMLCQEEICKLTAAVQDRIARHSCGKTQQKRQKVAKQAPDITCWHSVRDALNSTEETREWYRLHFLCAFGHTNICECIGTCVPEMVPETIRNGAPHTLQAYPSGMMSDVEKLLIVLKKCAPSSVVDSSACTMSLTRRFLGLATSKAHEIVGITAFPVSDFSSVEFLSLAGGIDEGRFCLWCEYDTRTDTNTVHTYDAEDMTNTTERDFMTWGRSVITRTGKGGELPLSLYPPSRLCFSRHNELIGVQLTSEGLGYTLQDEGRWSYAEAVVNVSEICFSTEYGVGVETFVSEGVTGTRLVLLEIGGRTVHSITDGSEHVASPSISFNGDLILWLSWDAQCGVIPSGTSLCVASVRRHSNGFEIHPVEMAGRKQDRFSILDGSESAMVMSPCFFQDRGIVYLCDQTCDTFRLYHSKYDMEKAQYEKPVSLLDVGSIRSVHQITSSLCVISASLVALIASHDNVDILLTYDVETASTCFFKQTFHLNLTCLHNIKKIDATRVVLFASGPCTPQQVIVVDFAFRTVRSIATTYVGMPPLASATAVQISPYSWLFLPTAGVVPIIPEHSGEGVIDGRVPLMLCSHSGCYDTWQPDSYDAETQYWCSNGYGVVHCRITEGVQFGRAVKNQGKRKNVGAGTWVSKAAGELLLCVSQAEKYTEVDYYHVAARGRGLGALVALHASQHAGSLIRVALCSAFVSPTELSCDVLPLSKLRVPVFFVHSKREEVGSYDAMLLWRNELMSCLTYHGKCGLLTIEPLSVYGSSWVISAEHEKQFLLETLWDVE